MVCGTTCLLGAGFVGSMVFCMVSTKDAKVFKRFEGLLQPDQLLAYKNIANERLNIYLQGFFIGLVHRTDPAFDYQLVRRGIPPKALKRRTTNDN